MTRITTTLALVAILLPGAAGAVTPEQFCRSAKVGAAGKFSACRAKADAAFERSPMTATDDAKRDLAYTKCEASLAKAYGLAEGKYGPACPAEWTVDAVAGLLTECAVLPTPTPTPTPEATPTPTPEPTATPEVCPTPEPNPTPCAVVDNGKGGTYTDNCDGTVTDSTTGLVWEKKDDSGGIHDKDRGYSLSKGYPWNPDGTAFTDFLPALNTSPCFARNCSWRLPTIKELGGIEAVGVATGGIVDRTVLGCNVSPYATPCINPIFGPTRSGEYWSRPDDYWSYTVPASDAWFVLFDYGRVGNNRRDNVYRVRAVRFGFEP